MPADQTLQLIADTLAATEAAMPSPDADRIPLRTAELSTAGQLAQALEAVRELRIQLDRAEGEARAMVRDRDEVIAERDKARAELKQARTAADFRAGVIELRRQELADAGRTIEHTRTERDRLVDAIGRMISLPPDAIARAYNVGYGTEAVPERVACTCDTPSEPGFPHRPWCATQHQHPGPDCAGLCAPSPGSGPTRAQGSPDPRHIARIDRTGWVWFPDGNGRWRGAGTCHLNVSTEVLERLHGPTVEAVVVPAAPEPIRPADWEQPPAVAGRGCDDCSVEPGERHRYAGCPGAGRDATLAQIRTEAAQVQADVAAGRIADRLGGPTRVQGLHVTRGTGPSDLEADCPCGKAPCGSVDTLRTDETCTQHPASRAQTMRQMHRPDQCPATP